MGQGDRPRRGDRHRQAVRHLLERARLFPRLDQSGEPRSEDPASPAAPTFPPSPSPTSCARKALVGSLGVKRLVLVADPSYGGFEAFQWAVAYSHFVGGAAPIVTAPYSLTPSDSDRQLTVALAKDSNWTGWRHYDRGGVVATVTKLRDDILKS